MVVACGPCPFATTPRTLPPAQSRGVGSSQETLREICGSTMDSLSLPWGNFQSFQAKPPVQNSQDELHSVFKILVLSNVQEMQPIFPELVALSL